MQRLQTTTLYLFERSVNKLYCNSGWYQTNVHEEFDARKVRKTTIYLKKVTNTLTPLPTSITQAQPGTINYKWNPKY